MLVVRGPQASADEKYLRLLVEEFGGRGTTEFISPQSVFEDTILVGGQIANPSYKAFVDADLLPEIEYNALGFGHIFHTKVNGHNVWAIAGRAAEGTSKATDWALKRGLPFEDIIVPVASKDQVVKISFEPGTLFGGAILTGVQSGMVDNLINKRIQAEAPNYELADLWLDSDRGNLHALMRNKNSVSALPLAGLVVVLPQILTAVTWVVAAIAGAAAVKFIRDAVVVWSDNAYKASMQKSSDFEKATEAHANGDITSDQYSEIAKEYFGNNSTQIPTFGNIGNTIIVGGALLVGGYLLYQGFKKD